MLIGFLVVLLWCLTAFFLSFFLSSLVYPFSLMGELFCDMYAAFVCMEGCCFQPTDSDAVEGSCSGQTEIGDVNRFSTNESRKMNSY